jgi:hypothetical protein
MHFRDLFASRPATFSFEFFPPRTPAAAEELFINIRELEQLKPTFVSVTYGAGGSTRQLTHDLVLRLKTQTALSPVPHLTTVCHTDREVRALLERYAAARTARAEIPTSRSSTPRTWSASSASSTSRERTPTPRVSGSASPGSPRVTPTPPTACWSLTGSRPRWTRGRT